MAQLLLIEDDDRVRTALIRSLSALNHQVSSAPDAMTGLRHAVDHHPELVILDLGLPDLDGKELLKMLRGVSDVPVIVATARDDENEIVQLLRNGADDYVVKPFTAAQMDARIHAVLRRATPDTKPASAAITVGDLRIDAAGRVADLDGSPLDLAPKEFDVLYYLATRVGEVVTKKELLTEVWDSPWGGADKTVDVHIAWLRRKLGETAASPRLLHTVRGVGIKLMAPDGEAS